QDVQEALRLARLALGPEAVILQTRRVPSSGLMKLVGRPRVEVLAAIDTPEAAARRQAASIQGHRGGAAVADALASPSRRPPRAADAGFGPADPWAVSGNGAGGVGGLRSRAEGPGAAHRAADD